MFKYNDYSSHQYDSATNIARVARGMDARKHAKLLLWAKYNWAATKISRAYRRWAILKALYISTYRRVRDRKCINQPAVTNIREAFTKIIDSKAIYEDKMAIWRLAVELRRGHNMQTTDTCIKAILESQADSKQAITFLGIPEFCVRHFVEVPKHTKRLFLPENKLNANAIRNIEYDWNNMDMQRSSGIETIRALKRLQKRQTLINTINKVVSKCYFSKFHVGSKYSQPAYPKIGDMNSSTK